jgi:osmotically-inducible protein OsmY
MKKLNFFVLGSYLLISGCMVAAVGAAAVATVDVVHDRRTVGRYIDDGKIEIDVRQFVIRDKELRNNAHISVTSWNGIVLLTGEVPGQAQKAKVVNYTKSVASVRQVVDELRIAGKTAVFSRANDTWLTSKVKTQLFAETKLDANRIKVVSEYGNVYLMGIVTREEAQQATDIARNIGGVVRVVKVFEYTN